MFRKLVDAAGAGDLVGVLLSRVKTDDDDRGDRLRAAD
jgi:translation elongation factor EF-Tu-like GTPase